MKHEHFMERALELAKKGEGSVSPNPMVGCVLVHNDIIIGEGWHKKFGEAHAEVNAINSVIDKSLIPLSTAYVSLEPCSHFGKTPPCADLLIKEGVSKVVICNTDPNLKVNGNGIQKLKNAGIEVVTGILEEKGSYLNRRFFKSQTSKKPYVILKWAESANGCVANSESKPVQISGDFAQLYSHKWRSNEDAIMVGSKTVINDNPSLSTRYWSGKNPIRVVLFPDIDINAKYQILDQSVKTYVFNKSHSLINGHVEFIKFNVNSNILDFILSELHQRDITSLMVEGGPRLHEMFINNNLYDEIRVFKSKKLIIPEGLNAVTVPKNLLEIENIDLKTDFLRIYSKEFQP
ncbi:bifunctional diaminohydroxyphosphoribosylaminopyrimidine deaminase/5-amino-6-(5-phosphoribosylamino)uracil reductase RibD [Arcticibacterium luteifluviistationis]|uniref:Riboflavin biosynthesis protein RibD n=1 Tax=Arcticibacterium luteifluviistationis TaxID=1784714 RepID=A0A2Z4GDW4_9BACT|nr:bifunctional diaminohydroxyphosphoribosylaminopyrimidine deaminase/5-amino-6-(5-phosphoribosylamino)uracil reductase RibD [Arcticibacterium luteifluviistationis]AWV99364.1 bifunctional diaminohydroxyphosphoribosylaminopyrimidine deaminase/5-amino-6-(5-phosphoribosylamino)uracil reductase RibD [Arcticibacterium luteifluviistationis]